MVCGKAEGDEEKKKNKGKHEGFDLQQNDKKKGERIKVNTSLW